MRPPELILVVVIDGWLTSCYAGSAMAEDALGQVSFILHGPAVVYATTIPSPTNI